MDCDLRDHIQQQIYFFGAYEPIDASLFLSLIPVGGVAVDAGANIGFYSLMMAERVGAEGQVHSFEPLPRNFAALQKNVGLNPQILNIRTNAVALWNREEVLKFSIGAQHLFNSGGYSSGKVESPFDAASCPAITLKEYFERNDLTRLDAIKMDIEGAELFALQGMLPLLEKHHPVILLEVSRGTCQAFDYQPDDLWKLLQPLGYKIYQIGSVLSQSGWIPDFSQIDQTNVLLVPDRSGQPEPSKVADGPEWPEWSECSEWPEWPKWPKWPKWPTWDDKKIRRTFLNYR